MLEGYDSNYNVISSQEAYTISYTKLHGDDYKLKIYILDASGNRGYNDISISIHKDKHLYEYWSFRITITAIIAIAVFSLIFLFVSLKLKKARKRAEEYKKITLEAILAIAKTIDAKDKYTNGHSIRVGKYSRLIAKALNMSNDEVERIYYIALLHDIGKIAIPDKILNKENPLNDQEFEIMKTHASIGAEILSGISTIEGISEGAHYHHEKYNGKGYPNGLKGEEIPYIARIICCADTYDAMATKRCYKEAYSKERMLEEFEKGKGVQFDPKIAEVTIELIKNDKFQEDDE